MDNYALYHHVKSAQSVAAQYSMGMPLARQLEDLATQQAARTYTVAVVGEFKRGKSSLVNCILGTQVLPTDILPTTAVVNRVVYDTQQRVDVCYKDGTVETYPLARLADFATKENEENARLIREIVVHYPTVFCQGNVQLLDTPGLNDDEFMDSTTLEVLDRVDTALVTTHAAYPISETEQRLICRLIEQPNIYHLTFVATFIDRVSDEREEQDRVVELIRDRLAVDTFTYFCQLHPDEPRLQEKARKILLQPLVFAVSSRQAMQGFVSGNQQLLEESRFPHFKYALSAQLTANQELDTQRRAAELVAQANRDFPIWHKRYLADLDFALVMARKQLQSAQDYQKNGCPGLSDKLSEVSRQSEKLGIFSGSRDPYQSNPAVRAATRLVLKNLLTLEPVGDVTKEAVQSALTQASREYSDLLGGDNAREKLSALMEEAALHLAQEEKKCGFWGMGMKDQLAAALEKWHEEHPFPLGEDTGWAFETMLDPERLRSLLREEEMVRLAQSIQLALQEKTASLRSNQQGQLRAYLASWKNMLAKYSEENKPRMAKAAEESARRIRLIRQQQEAAGLICEKNRQILYTAAAELGAGTEA